MRTGHPKRPLVLTADEQERLQSLAHRARSQPVLARRARVILASAQGLANHVVAKQVRCSPGMVNKWRSRFLKERLEGLYDEPRPGALRKVSDAQVEQVVIQTLESTPRAQTHWHPRSGSSQRAKSHDHQPDLARLRLAASSHRDLQTLARPLAHRQSARHRRPVYEPCGSRSSLLRRREEPDSSAEPHSTALAHAARRCRPLEALSRRMAPRGSPCSPRTCWRSPSS